MDILGAERNFASLSVKDLLEARDLYHYHLIHRANVVGTAIGLYLIRKSDTWPTRAKPKPGAAARSYRPRGERTLENSEVRDYSWPCIIVFVDKWVDAERFRGGGQGLPPEDMVPKTLYMPDGRTVPVCVIKVSPAEPASAPVLDVQWPDTFIGGGFPLISESQGTRRMASIGCLVSDGHTVYALTNRHVAGPAGQPILSVLRGAEVEIGASTDRQLTRLPFFEVYTDFPGRRTWLTLDIGLVALANLRDWTSQVYGLGALGALADLSERNITLRLIGAKIVAYGAISGRLSGQIKALFYRHRSIGGYDDVSDFLIAPAEDGSAQTRPGDSGTLWHLETTDAAQPLRPLAIQWGGQTFMAGPEKASFNFALATSLSNVCRLLDVELVRDHNTGVQPYWGATGHYSIGAYACDAVRSEKLRTLMLANRDKISFQLAELTPDKIEDVFRDARQNGGFVPLAECRTWSGSRRHRGSRAGGRVE